jgi:hypothetical protein
MDCVCCLMDITNENRILKHDNTLFDYCYDCFTNIAVIQKNYSKKIFEEDCLKTIRNLLIKGIPLYVFVEEQQGLYVNGKNINNLYSTKEEIYNICEMNKELKILSENSGDMIKEMVLKVFEKYN